MIKPPLFEAHCYPSSGCILTCPLIQHYNHLAHTAAESANAEYKRWVESHTPEEIQVANRARMGLRHKQPPKAGRGRNKWTAIQDERAIKRPLSAFLQFSVNRNASGDFRNIPVGERAKLIGKEWQALSESEKKVGRLNAFTTV